VWLDDDGALIKTGFGYKVNRDSRSITQLNSDGTITKYPYDAWAKKKASEAELKVLINDRKHAIPIQHDRMITLTIDKNSPYGKDALSPEELKYASENYVEDTGEDNNITDLFDAIKEYAKEHPQIWEEMAKWGTELAPIGLIPLYLNKN
jgi:hypothetical protein